MTKRKPLNSSEPKRSEPRRSLHRNSTSFRAGDILSGTTLLFAFYLYPNY